jgi:predicted phage terminase large subunit-like protein
MVAIVRAWDLAFSDKESADFLAGCKMGIDRAGNRYILHLIRVKGRWTEGKLKIIETALSDGSNVTCSIESNGTQLGYFYDIQADTRMRSRRVVSDKPQGDKEMRASMWGSRLCDRIVKCVRGPWNQMLFDQMDYFPSAGEHDDLVDSVSAGWAQLGDAQNAPAESVHVDRHVSMSEHRSKFAI